MFSKSIISLSALALAAVSSAKPIPAFREVLAKRGYSFNNYGGHEQLRNFDNFYGNDDYSGVHQNLHEEKHLVCHTERIEIVQQHLSVIREWYKKIVTEQICEVEVQTIVHHQFLSGCESFCGDLRRESGRHVSYDHEIAGHIGDLHDNSNECSVKDLGFHGSDVGSHAISYSGDNWIPSYSKEIVSTAWDHAKQSYGYSSPSYSHEWSSGYTPKEVTYGYESAPEVSHEVSHVEHVEDPSYGYGHVEHVEEKPSYGYGNVEHVEEKPSYGYGNVEHVEEKPSYGGSVESAPYGGSVGSAYGGSVESSPSSGVSVSSPSDGPQGNTTVTPSVTPGSAAQLPPPSGSDSTPASSNSSAAVAGTDAAATGTEAAAAATGTDAAAAAATTAA